MVLRRSTGEIRHSSFSELASWLPDRSLLVVNDARVTPARLFGRRGHRRADRGRNTGPAPVRLRTRYVRVGMPYQAFQAAATGGMDLNSVPASGPRWWDPAARAGGFLDFSFDVPPAQALERLGRMPLPPYIKRASGPAEEDPMAELDKERYQTVYAPGGRRGCGPHGRASLFARPFGGAHFQGV